MLASGGWSGKRENEIFSWLYIESERVRERLGEKTR